MRPYKKYLRFLLPALPIILGTLALLGWTLDIASLKQGIASGVAMNPATALGFILLGLEVFRLHARINNPLASRIGQLAIWMVIIASAMKLGDLVLGTSFGIDQLLFAAQLDKYLTHPNRMAPNTTLCFFLLGWAMLSLRSRSKAAISTAQALTMIPALFIPLAIVGYIYGTESFYGLGSYIPMAFNTAIAFLFLIAAILFTYPHDGFMRVFTSGGSAGKIAPILLPATLIVPFLVGWITLAVLNAKLIDPALDHALSVVINIAIFFALSYFSIRTLYFSDLQRQKADAEQKLAELKAEELKMAKINEAYLIAVNKELDDFTYIAAHDLKEPLRGIHNYAGILKEDYAGQMDEGARQYVNSIQRLAERLSFLIDRLLAYSRVGSTELVHVQIDVDAVVDEVAEDLNRLWTKEGIELRRNGRLGTITGDATRVGEIFQNLISNAAKYNDKPSKWIEVGCNHSGTPPIFYVRDNGIGIAPQHHENVFRIFKRLHEVNKYGGGTGAGLTIVKKIIERHGGRIWLESVPGEGTVFYFTLGREQ
jgi:signal transduction histidine kinase